MNVEKLRMYICKLLSFPFPPPSPIPNPNPHPIPNHNKIGYYLNDWCPSDMPGANGMLSFEKHWSQTINLKNYSCTCIYSISRFW